MLVASTKGVKQDDRLFYIDLNMNRVGTETFDFAWDFHEGLAQVQQDGIWFYVDRDMKRVVAD